MTRRAGSILCAVVITGVAACRGGEAPSPPRASGFVEATEVRIASRVPGRVAEVAAVEGQRVEAGATLVALATTEIDLAIRRAEADRAQADAQLALLLAGSRVEDIRQGEANVATAASEKAAAQAELDAAKTDEARYEQLLRSRAGTAKQRDDAVARRELAEATLAAAEDRRRAAVAALSRLQAGARPEELSAARARVAAVTAQIASLEHDRAEALIVAPSAGVVSSRLVEPGELVASGQALVVIIDLDHAWANAFVEEPIVPTLRIDGQATVTTDAGDALPGRISFIASRAEFTPRNVQTASERAKLVYRVKIAVDNSKGVLKPGMPVEVTFAGGAP
jgi:HlyD family secretion protein